MKKIVLIFLGLTRGCTDVTSGIFGLNSWACRACKRVRASFMKDDFGLPGFDNTFTMDLIFPSPVEPRPTNAFRYSLSVGK